MSCRNGGHLNVSTCHCHCPPGYTGRFCQGEEPWSCRPQRPEGPSEGSLGPAHTQTGAGGEEGLSPMHVGACVHTDAVWCIQGLCCTQ